MKIKGHYAQVSDTGHGCGHTDLDVIIDSNWQMIECTRCKKRWERIAQCCALDFRDGWPVPCPKLVEQPALPFCPEHMKDEALVRAWMEIT